MLPNRGDSNHGRASRVHRRRLRSVGRCHAAQGGHGEERPVEGQRENIQGAGQRHQPVCQEDCEGKWELQNCYKLFCQFFFQLNKYLF